MTAIGETILNLNVLEEAPLQSEPYPFVILQDFIRPSAAPVIHQDFPAVSFGGSVPLPGLRSGPGFQHLIQELEGDELRRCLEIKFSVDLSDRPTFITVRGRTRAKDGRIHTDTKSKILTLLLYFNREWTAEGGRLRILRNAENLDSYVAEVTPSFGTCLIFKVTDNCWHGHKPFEGERRAIQMNYLANHSALKQHLSKHRLSARFKGFKQWLSRGDEY